MSSKSNVRPARKRDDKREEELAIRFVNTVAWRLQKQPEERLSDAASLLRWLRENGIGSREVQKRLASQWKDDPERGASALRMAVSLRETLYDILIATIAREPPPKSALDRFSRMFSRAVSQAALEWRAGELAWGGEPRSDGLDLFRPVLVSAAELISGPRSNLVKQCQDDRGCGWLFVDDSPASNRRWCSMGDCGNRAKASRHFDRSRRRRSNAK